MPRGRMLDKEAVSQSKKLSELSNDTGRLVYTWLLAHLDAEGRFSADPLIIKGIVFPRITNLTTAKIEKSINEMAQIGLIIIYHSDGDKYLQYIKFREYQNLDKNREAPSKLPSPTEENISNSGVAQSKSDLVALSKVKISKDNISKDKYGEFVLLSKEEYQKLIEQFGKELADDKITDLNYGIGSKGYKYTDHYLTILSWDRREKKKKKEEQDKKPKYKELPTVEPEEEFKRGEIPPDIKERMDKIKIGKFIKD